MDTLTKVDYAMSRPPNVTETTSLQSTTIQAARAEKIYNAKIGKSRDIPSFETALSTKLTKDHPEKKTDPKVAEDAKKLFGEVTTKAAPQIKDIIKEIKKLGIEKDILNSDEFRLLTYGIKADLWGETQRKDYPSTEEGYQEDPLNPLNEIKVENGLVSVKTLNPDLNTQSLQKMLQDHYGTIRQLTAASLSLPKDVADFASQQAVAREILHAKPDLKSDGINLDGATLVKVLGKEDMKQASNPVELWQTPDGRKLVVKRASEGAEHTLNAEILENRLMALMGIPVPETNLQQLDGKQVLVVGFLDKYGEEQDPFALSEKYHTSRTLQRGLLVDVWLNQYNRRPHNLMMKDGKIAFIDHGAGAFSRATGGFKEFSPYITSENLWDNLRTIPDNNPNGDVPVNEAYDQIATVVGGPNGEVQVKDPAFLRTELNRLSKITSGQIKNVVREAGYTNDIDQLRQWISSDAIQGRIQKLEQKPHDQLTSKDLRDLRWTKGAIKTFEDAIKAGGMQNYMAEVIPQVF